MYSPKHSVSFYLYIFVFMLKKPINNTVKIILFWIIMYGYLLSSHWFKGHDKIFLTKYIAYKVFLQFLLSIIIIKLLIPYVLNKKKNILFIIYTLVAIYVMQTLYSVARATFLLAYFERIYNMPPYILWDKMTSFSNFIRNITWITFPSVVLISINHYRNQRDIVELKEQKKATELNLLKNQLNPHFLFNTLNNLYALALKKSDKTPEVIAKLSEILDYILYQCKDKYVPINKEIELLENYIALEKVRYGKRVEVIFEKNIQDNVDIAPLILLTFVENAFKHGVSQELNKALIELSIVTTDTEIFFKLKNSKPKSYAENVISDKDSIGMQNTKKQLDLLYPNAYELKVENTAANYSLELKLELHEKV